MLLYIFSAEWLIVRVEVQKSSIKILKTSNLPVTSTTLLSKLGVLFDRVIYCKH